MQPLHIIKKEIRILGLDACKPGLVLGAIVRGGQYLDGVMKLQVSEPLDGSAVSRFVRTSRYYPELRVIMIHDQKVCLNSELIERSTELPIIQLADKTRSGFNSYLTKRGALNLKTRLAKRTVEQIISLTWIRGTMPEPLRISHLLSKCLPVTRGKVHTRAGGGLSTTILTSKPEPRFP